MQLTRISNRVMAQLLLIAVIIVLNLIIVKNLSYFISGALGAITLYVLFRNLFFYLTEKLRWKRWFTSLFLMLLSLILIVVPIWILVEILIPQITELLDNRQIIIDRFNQVKDYLQENTILLDINISAESIIGYLQNIAAYIPKIVNSIAALLVNVLTALFILYFMQINGRKMERTVYELVPLSEASKAELWNETKKLVNANAIGIPVLGFFQALVAVIGYWIFGINNPVLWGLLTGVSTIIPMIGTMVVWIPMSIVVLATGDWVNALGLFLYGFIVIGGIDNVLRFTILKTLGNVHPLITVFGVLLGLNLFGMIGLIFGPLLLSYAFLLIRLYRNEFGATSIRRPDERERRLPSTYDPIIPPGSHEP